VIHVWTLLVTGASGFLGGHVLAAATGVRVVAPPSSALDVRDAAAVLDAVRAARPDAVLHLAYRKHDPEVIVAGSRHVAEAARDVGARLVHVSTDAVFGGRPAPYREDDLPSPVEPYGRAKAEAEAAVLAARPGAVVVRTSLLYGTARPGPAQDDVARVLDGEAAMTFFTDEVRALTHAGDLAEALLRLAERPDVVGPLHVAGPEAMDRLTFARRVAHALARDGSALVGGTIAGCGLVRPAHVVLDSARSAALGLTVRPVSAALPAPTEP
jgi:dTDP-4-dehydrorhamnose reductase